MSGIYIPGMEMPPKGIQRTLVITSHEALETSTREWRGYIKHEVIPVPPHGRLIDADVLAVHKFAGAEHDISTKDGGACYRRGWNDAIEAIMENAETIIGEE